MSNSGSPRHAASNGTAQAIRGGEDSASNAVRRCSGRVTGTTTLQLLPARSMGSSASLLMATSSATAPGTTTRSLAGDFRHPDCTRRHKQADTAVLHKFGRPRLRFVRSLMGLQKLRATQGRELDPEWTSAT